MGFPWILELPNVIIIAWHHHCHHHCHHGIVRAISLKSTVANCLTDLTDIIILIVIIVTIASSAHPLGSLWRAELQSVIDLISRTSSLSFSSWHCQHVLWDFPEEQTLFGIEAKTNLNEVKVMPTQPRKIKIKIKTLFGIKAKTNLNEVRVMPTQPNTCPNIHFVYSSIHKNKPEWS